MKLPTRWLVWGGIALVVLLAVGTIRGIQPIADDTVAPATTEEVSGTSDATASERTAAKATVSVTDGDVDRVFDQMLAMLEEIASGEQSATQEEQDSNGEQGGQWSDEDAPDGQRDDTGEAHAAEDSGTAGESAPAETVVSDFIFALQSMNIDKMLSMARGQAHTKISELKRESLPPEAMAMFSQIEATNGRLVSENEFRFSLSMPTENESPEIVMRRDSGTWWIDEIIE